VEKSREVRETHVFESIYIFLPHRIREC